MRRLLTSCALAALLSATSARAVVPYRAPEDEQPSIAARAHWTACRQSALQILNSRAHGSGKIESESYLQRGDAEFFRFLLRFGDNEIFIICDAHNGVIRRQIDLWREL